MFYGAESGWLSAETGRTRTKVALGYWHFSGDLVEPDGSASDGMSGRYLLAEHEYKTNAGPIVAGFVRAGEVIDPCAEIGSYVGTGVRVAAPFKTRPNDIVSFGLAKANIQAPFRPAGSSVTSETTFELTWLVQLHDRVAIQPDLQYVKNPMGTHGVKDATLAGLRIIFSY